MNIKKIIATFLILIFVGTFPVFAESVSTYGILSEENDLFLQRIRESGIEEEKIVLFFEDFDREISTLQIPEYRKDMEIYFLSILFNVVLEKEENAEMFLAFDTVFQDEFLEYINEDKVELPPVLERFFILSVGDLIKEEPSYPVYTPAEPEPAPEETPTPEETPAPEEKFSDLENYEWAKEYIEKLSEKGIIEGYEDKTFKPQNFITRAEAVKIITTTFLKTGYVVLESEFADVTKDLWYYKYVANAEYYALFAKMYGDDFEGDKYITRQEFCGLAYRAYNKVGNKLKENHKGITFYDSDNIKNFAYEAVTVMQRAGIIKGMPNGFFLPDNSITRAEASKIICMLLERK